MSDYHQISDSFTQINELTKKSEQLIAAQNYHKAISLISNAVSLNGEYAALYLKLSECYFKIGQHCRSKKYLDQGFTCLNENSSYSASSLHIQFYLMDMQLAMRCRVIEHLKLSIKNLEDALQNVGSSEVISEPQNKINTAKELLKELETTSDMRKRKEEGLEVMRMIKDEEERAVLNQEGIPTNIISSDWFDSWRRYVMLELDDQKSSRSNNDELLDDEYPGPIRQDKLISENSLIFDPDQVKEYTNYVIKEGMLENSDFHILPHRVWKFLYKKYGGDELKRYKICINDETDENIVEVFLKRVKIYVFPRIQDDSNFLSFQLSKKERVIDLKKKILRCLETRYECNDSFDGRKCRIWKLNPDSEMSLIESKYSNDDRILTSNLLQDETPLEECDIADEDILLLDLCVNKNPFFLTKQEYEESKLTRCGNCQVQDKKLLFCECKKIKYCGEACQKLDRPNHRSLCEMIRKEASHVNEKMRVLDISEPIKLTTGGKNGLTGLQNLGNTCFMNSSLQCLSHVQELTTYFLANEHVGQINRDNKLGTGGYLASGYGELVKKLWCGTEKYISPWKLKKIVEKFAPQFSGYQQHDSQELLSYMLDGLHEDLNRVKVKPYIDNVESTGKEKDEEVAEKSWEVYLKRNQSKIADLMTGQYKSTLTCPRCSKISITFDPFLSIPLPIPGETDLSSFYLYYIPADTSVQPQKVIMNLPNEHKVCDIKNILSQEFEIIENKLKFYLIRNNVIQEELSDERTVEYIDSTPALLFVFEIDDPKLRQVNIVIKGDDEKKKTFDRLLSIPQNLNSGHLLSLVHLLLKPFISRVIELSEDESKFESEVHEIYEIQNLIKVRIGDMLLSLNSQAIPDFDTIEVTLSNSLDATLMKFNKCSEHTLKHKFKVSKSFEIQRCFNLFTKEETLEEGNEWYCGGCKDHMKATKKMELYKLPDILILHLKRFKTGRPSRYGNYSHIFSTHTSKIDSLIEFPLIGLNLSSYEISNRSNDAIFDCFAVSNHYGGTGGGHYTAFCKNFINDNWYEFNDSQVLRVTESDIVRNSAYVLFYRRRNKL